MVTVVCVEVGNYLGRGREYVEKLRGSVARHLKAPHEFVIVTDDPRRHPIGSNFRSVEPGLVGWWVKCQLFKHGLFEGRVLYLDLDTVIVGPLDPIAEAKGILYLSQWGWDKHTYGSGVMCWDAGEHRDVWNLYTNQVPLWHQGDQDWITKIGGWPSLPMYRLKSYRYHCKKGVPPGTSVVCFHGKPRPHEVSDRFVLDHWKA